MLGDFRKGFFGRLALEAPPTKAEVAVRKQAKNDEISARLRNQPVASTVVYGQEAIDKRQFQGAGEFEGW
jgi:hypothetical protein